MKSFKKIFTGLVIIIFLFPGNLFAQKDNRNENINEQQKKALFTKAVTLMKENYIFPERIAKIESVIKKKFDTKAYAGLNTLFDFLEVLNKDFETSGTDHHLNIFYSPEYVKKLRAAESNTSEVPQKIPAEFVDMVKYENFYLKKTERLDGNIGYFKFNKFEELQFSKESIASAMNFISNSSAIILDLTQNGGGSAETVHFFLSYFLPDLTNLGQFKRRKNNEVIDLRIIKDPVVKKIPDSIPLYILVSKGTSSAAESLVYSLQQFKRAIIVGEQTHGEGNPGARFVINDNLYIMIPTAVNINAITGTSWEGTGVTPDIKTDAGSAFAKTMIELCKVLSNTGNNIYKWMLPEYEAQLNPEVPTPAFINLITGSYEEGKKIAQEDCSLYYYPGTGRRKMSYMGNQTFLIEGRKDYRMKFYKNSNNFEVLWNDGSSDQVKKVN